jgi:hypothetical protein
MKNKFTEALFSLLALYLFSCVIAAAIVLGMLLVPFVFVALLVKGLIQLTLGKIKTKKTGAAEALIIKRKVTAIIHRKPSLKKAAA